MKRTAMVDLTLGVSDDGRIVVHTQITTDEVAFPKQRHDVPLAKSRELAEAVLLRQGPRLRARTRHGRCRPSRT